MRRRSHIRFDVHRMHHLVMEALLAAKLRRRMQFAKMHVSEEAAAPVAVHLLHCLRSSEDFQKFANLVSRHC